MEITSVSNVLDHAAGKYFKEQHGHWVFRGHSDAAYTLVPSVGRGQRTAPTVAKHEQSLFTAFKRELSALMNYSSYNDWEILSLAQHHGLPTRFLDWSHNILISLYFAVNAHPGADGTLFALNAVASTPEALLSESPFHIKEPTKYYPVFITPRIRAQEGLFVSCARPDLPLSENLRKGWSYEQIIIPRSAKPRILYELFRLGVHASSLFPDIDGLASRIKWTHGVHSPFRDAQAISATVGAPENAPTET